MKKKIKETGKPHDEVAQTQIKICSWAMTSAVIFALGFTIFHQKTIAKGLLLGTLFSIINFVLLGKSIPMTLGQSRTKASAIGFASVLLRYTVMAIPLIVALKSASFNFASVVVGIFAVQLVALVDYIVLRPIIRGK